ncbi:MAG: cob(I)yrinic acid a,c-diamide adenosyltransferase [Phycisphaerae bacterium]|nr:cob(I)yrinic acid a,c-diamide adenosyltransferase [Phycisphaerae bacterium]
MTKTPRILLFTGDGKGKTTAALGMALRAAGHGMRVVVVQFLKSDRMTGEIHAAARLGNIEILPSGLGFVPPTTDPRFARHKAAAEQALARASEFIAAGQHAVVVLDEVCGAIANGLLAEASVIDAVRQAGPDLCIVLTGRGATKGLIDLADTVTEMTCVKHAYKAGRAAQKGVEM